MHVGARTCDKIERFEQAFERDAQTTDDCINTNKKSVNSFKD